MHGKTQRDFRLTVVVSFIPLVSGCFSGIAAGTKSRTAAESRRDQVGGCQQQASAGAIHLARTGNHQREGRTEEAGALSGPSRPAGKPQKTSVDSNRHRLPTAVDVKAA